MPYEWVKKLDKAPEFSGALSIDRNEVLAELHLWPYRSLPKRGFAFFIAMTASLLALPLVQVLGTPVLWGLLPFIVLTVMGVWYALTRSYRDGELLERLELLPDVLRLEQRTRHGVKRWEANPHWVRVTLHETGGPVPNYLTLTGAGREVEIGAFLSEGERIRLADELRGILVRR